MKSNNKQIITIKDVANACGVSITTVSRVINNSQKGVGPETVDKVKKAMLELHYQPNGLAQGMISGKTNIIGLILPDIRNPFFAELARGVEDYCNENQYSCLLCNTDGIPKKELSYVNYFSGRMADGIIFTAQNATENNETIKNFSQTNVPFCLIERYVDGMEDVPGIFFDNQAGAEMIVDHLFENGHKKIAIISGPLSTANAVYRLHGYQDSLVKHGISFDKDLFIEADYLLDGGYNSMKQLLERNVEFTAVFAANDLMGLGAIYYLNDQGKNIPNDYSVVGFDNISPLGMSRNGVTSIDIPAYEMGFSATKLLIYKILGKKIENNRIIISPRLVENGTVKNIR